MEPCSGTPISVSLILAMGQALQLLLTAWLAHRRKTADHERRRFYLQMREKHGLQLDAGERKWKREH